MKPLIGMTHWVADWEFKAATALFFSEVQRSSNLCWYRLQMQKHQLTAPEWIQKKQDFEDSTNPSNIVQCLYVVFVGEKQSIPARRNGAKVAQLKASVKA